MKALTLVGAVLMSVSMNLLAETSEPIASIVKVTGLAQAVSDGNLCLGIGGATSLGGVIMYDGKRFKCVSGKAGSGEALAGWVAYSK